MTNSGAVAYGLWLLLEHPIDNIGG